MSSDLITGVLIGVIVGLILLAISNVQKLKDLPWEICLEIKYRRMKLVDDLLVREMSRIDEEISRLKQEQHGLHPSAVEPELRRLEIMKLKAHRIYYKRFTKESEKVDKIFRRWASQGLGSEYRKRNPITKIIKAFRYVIERIRSSGMRESKEEVVIDGIGELWAVPRQTRNSESCTERVYISPIYIQIKGGYLVRREKPIEPYTTQHPGPEFAIKKDGKDIVVLQSTPGWQITETSESGLDMSRLRDD